MADDREKISTGPNEEPINETIAGTGPGIPDDALAPGEELPEPPSDEQVKKTAEALEHPWESVTRCRSRVNDSRPPLTDDSVIVQF